MKSFTITLDEKQVQAVWLCADAALRSSGVKALDAAVAVQAALNTATPVKEQDDGPAKAGGDNGDPAGDVAGVKEPGE